MRYVLLILIFWSTNLVAQTTIGLLPEIAISKSWKNGIRLSNQFESMQQLLVNTNDTKLSNEYEYIRSDWTTIVSYKFRPQASVGIGMLNRFTDDGWVQRTIQQVSFKRKLHSTRLGQRFRTDQTFAQNEDVRFRFRYRFATEIPLVGFDINDNEWYMMSSTEVVSSLQNQKWEMEHRVLASIGHYFSKKHKLESGIDYRLSNYTTDSSNGIWWMINYYINF